MLGRDPYFKRTMTTADPTGKVAYQEWVKEGYLYLLNVLPLKYYRFTRQRAFFSLDPSVSSGVLIFNYEIAKLVLPPPPPLGDGATATWLPASLTIFSPTTVTVTVSGTLTITLPTAMKGTVAIVSVLGVPSLSSLTTSPDPSKLIAGVNTITAIKAGVPNGIFTITLTDGLMFTTCDSEGTSCVTFDAEDLLRVIYVGINTRACLVLDEFTFQRLGSLGGLCAATVDSPHAMVSGRWLYIGGLQTGVNNGILTYIKRPKCAANYTIELVSEVEYLVVQYAAARKFLYDGDLTRYDMINKDFNTKLLVYKKESEKEEEQK